VLHRQGLGENLVHVTKSKCIDAMMEKRKKKKYTMGILRKVENH